MILPNGIYLQLRNHCLLRSQIFVRDLEMPFMTCKNYCLTSHKTWHNAVMTIFWPILLITCSISYKGTARKHSTQVLRFHSWEECYGWQRVVHVTSGGITLDFACGASEWQVIKASSCINQPTVQGLEQVTLSRWLCWQWKTINKYRILTLFIYFIHLFFSV